ncbi:hypothetical protein [Methanosarcina barkeri]|uniref:hypothetical protein n=1 Tax=Methanosarcina barkeri TaxID=2208 RepID=UPI000AA21AB4|nr:hypothetical protein [Methanosarcina barkeri]
MSFTLNIETNFSPHEVTEAIRSALEHEKHVARYKIKSYSAICRDFETKFGFSSAELQAELETPTINKESSFFRLVCSKKRIGPLEQKT